MAPGVLRLLTTSLADAEPAIFAHYNLAYQAGANGEQHIAAYVATGEWEGKAGAYGIQGVAEVFVERLSGSHSGVMGLPLHETSKLLTQFGIPFLQARAATDSTDEHR